MIVVSSFFVYSKTIKNIARIYHLQGTDQFILCVPTVLIPRGRYSISNFLIIRYAQLAYDRQIDCVCVEGMRKKNIPLSRLRQLAISRATFKHYRHCTKNWTSLVNRVRGHYLCDGASQPSKSSIRLHPCTKL